MSENVCLVLVKLGLRRAPGEGGGGEDGVYHISGVSGGLERASKYMSNKKIFFADLQKMFTKILLFNMKYLTNI